MGIPCRSTAPGAKADPSQNPEPPPNRTRGGCSYGSEHAPANTPLWVFPVGAPPPVRKRTPAITPSQPPSHPGRVLLRFRARPADTPLRVFHVGAPPPVRKRTPARTPSHPPIAPGAGAPTVQSTPRPTRRYGHFM